jgi:hypothetical protein
MIKRIQKQLDDHPHFRGRTKLFRIESIGRSIVVSGRVPTYYLKQLLQETIKAVPEVVHIDNRVDVTAEYPPHGKSSL